MIETIWLWPLLSFLIGVGLAWGMTSARAKASRVIALNEKERQCAAAEARIEELRHQLTSLQTEQTATLQRWRQCEEERISAETKYQEATDSLQAQHGLLEEAKTTLSDAFRSLAAEALAGNNTGFLILAEEKFKALREENAVDLDRRQTSIEALVKPLTQLLSTYQEETKELESKRLRELSAVGEQLRQVAMAHVTLQSETSKLVNALRSPHVRGRWGEIALRKTAELAGMSPHCDFIEQATVTTTEGRLRPDMVVRLPSKREVVVDSKVPCSAFLESLESTNDHERRRALVRHATHVKQHVHQLASKEYWEQFKAAPEFVVLFIPNDSFLAAAAEQDPSLIESALSKNVVIATPTTFIALLKAIAFGWKQEQITEDAERISTLGQELSERMGVLIDHFSKVGGSLGKAVESYNAAVASFESRVLPSARKFNQLGAGSKKAIDELQSIDHVPRRLTTVRKS
ncbi:MAG: DNA recombination protein RmuC [Nitrospirales bacterium]|nr:DNA recombination protein RmuC [Nitrospira sp.]MDR4500061.1 DNA recombination protein RmuC [Nitrospirales bacterium]